MTAADEASACCESRPRVVLLGALESPPIAEPFPVREQLSIYEIDFHDADHYGINPDQLPLF